MQKIISTVVFTIILIFIIACINGPVNNQQYAEPPNNILINNQPISPIQPTTEPGDNIKWINYPTKKTTTDPGWGPVLTDIEQHLDPKHGKTYYSSDNITHGHESVHGINSDIRNTFGGTGKNGFYCLQNRAIILIDPKCRITDVAPLVPTSVRGHRYNLYLVKQTKDWNDVPTYIFDEWIAYINGTTTGIDQVKKGLYKSRTEFFKTASLVKENNSDDAISPMEFTYYALALCQTVKQKDPGYFQQHPEFAEFVAFNIRRSVLAFREAIQMEQFRWETTLIDTFISSENTKPLRDMSVELWGKPFCDRYLFTK